MCVVGSSVPLGLQQEPLGAGQGGVARPGSGSNAMLSEVPGHRTVLIWIWESPAESLRRGEETNAGECYTPERSQPSSSPESGPSKRGETRGIAER